jgi:hypothetical protein
MNALVIKKPRDADVPIVPRNSFIKSEILISTRVNP